MKRRRGVALIVALFAITLLFSFATGLIFTSVARHKEVTLTTNNNIAYQIAQAGIQKALQTMFYYVREKGWQLDECLTACQNCPLHTTDFAQIRDDFLARLKNGEYNWYYSLQDTTFVDTASTPAVFGVNIPFADGAYHIIFEDNLDGDGIDEDEDGYIWDVDGDDVPDPLVDTDAYIFAYITATHKDGSARQIRCGMLYAEWWIPVAAITSAGSVKLHGNVEVEGTAGSVRSNMNVDISGNVEIEQNVIATGKITLKGKPEIGGIIKEWAPPAPMPLIDWNDLYNQRDYLLTSTGKIYDKQGNLLYDGSKGKEEEDPNQKTWYGFHFHPKEWHVSGKAEIPPGNYYVETNIKFSGDVEADDDNPTSFFVRGSVDIGGKTELDANYFDTLIISEYDVKLHGHAELKGVIIAGEQVKITGDVEIKGAVVSMDQGDLSKKVKAKSTISVELGGHPEIKYDGPAFTRLKRTKAEIVKVDEVILK